MDTRIRFIIVGLLLVVSSLQVKAQKKVYSTTDEVAEASAKVFIELMQPEGDLYKLKKDYQITGVYIMDISVGDKGRIVSVFSVNREEGSVDFQNKLRYSLMERKLGYKIVKGKRFKFRYKFNFNK